MLSAISQTQTDKHHGISPTRGIENENERTDTESRLGSPARGPTRGRRAAHTSRCEACESRDVVCSRAPTAASAAPRVPKLLREIWDVLVRGESHLWPRGSQT